MLSVRGRGQTDISFWPSSFMQFIPWRAGHCVALFREAWFRPAAAVKAAPAAPDGAAQAFDDAQGLIATMGDRTVFFPRHSPLSLGHTMLARMPFVLTANFDRQAHLSRRIAVDWLPPASIRRGRRPRHRPIEPYRQRAALTQRCVVARPGQGVVAGRCRLRHTAQLSWSTHNVNPGQNSSTKSTPGNRDAPPWTVLR